MEHGFSRALKALLNFSSRLWPVIEAFVFAVELQQLVFTLQQALKAGDKDDVVLLNTLYPFLNMEVRHGFTFRDLLMAALLRVRNKAGVLVPFFANEAQQQIAANWCDRNIVLKARQLGMT